MLLTANLLAVLDDCVMVVEPGADPVSMLSNGISTLSNGISTLTSGISFQPFQVADFDRWDSTSTNGGGLTQGGPTTLTWSAIACAIHAANSIGSVPGTARIVLATAHPAKFPDAMADITGRRPALPARLSALMTEPERMTVLPNDLQRIEDFIKGRSRVAKEASR